MAAFTVGYRVGVGDLRSVPDDIHCGASPPIKPPAHDSMNASMLATTPWISSRCPATLVRFASSRSHALPP